MLVHDRAEGQCAIDDSRAGESVETRRRFERATEDEGKRTMGLEDEKIGVIRKYLRDALPGCTVEDGSRTHVDRTLLVFKGVERQSTVQITTALLDADHPSSHELDMALKNGHVAAKVLSSPVVYLTHRTLAIPEQ